MAFTEEQLKAAAKKAYAAGDMKAVEDLHREALRLRESSPQGKIAPVAAQFGKGSQEGIAQALGFPVDAVAGAISGIGQATGLYGPIENPIGGSETFRGLLEPFRQGIGDPQSRAERVANRMGQEIGASAAMLPAAMASPVARAAPMAAAGVEGAAALGSGAGASIANEVAPDSLVAEIAGALGGGLGAGSAASRASGLSSAPAAMRGGIEDQRMRAADAYGEVRADPRVISQDSVDNMAQGLSARMDAEKINPRLQPNSSAILDAILQDSAAPMRIEDMENMRRLTESAMPATASQVDKRLSGIMKGEITSYLDSLGDPIADGLKEGRDAYRRASAAQSVADAGSKAIRRAASTGTGGNEINAIRQNLRAILDNPRKARSFTKEELAQMEAVVKGDAPTNAMRSLSRMSPTSGGLSAMLGIGGVMASPAVALPIMGVAEGAKMVGERATRGQISKLLQSLAPDRVMSPSNANFDRIMQALLAARTTANAGQE